MPSVRYVKFAHLPVADPDRAIAFYTRNLGFDVLVNAPAEGGARWIELAVPGAETKLLMTRQHGASDANEPALVLVVDDVAALAARLEAAGVEFTQPPGPAPWDARETYAVFRDSERNLVQIGDG